MNGTLYGVGIGPGDPELITLKAVRIIEQSPVIAVPKTGESRRVALSIAEQTIPHIHEKEVLSLHFPMTKDKCMIDTNRDEIAKQIIDILKEGKDIAIFNIGRPFRLFYLLVHSSARCKTRISGTNDCRRSFLLCCSRKIGYQSR